MIRINLLAIGPKARKVKPQWDVRAEALLGVGVLMVTLVGCGYYASSLDDEIQTKQSDKQNKDKQVAQLKEQVKAVHDFEQKKKDDKEFAANSWAMLYYIYTNSKYYEKTHNRYPIFRVM